MCIFVVLFMLDYAEIFVQLNLHEKCRHHRQARLRAGSTDILKDKNLCTRTKYKKN